MNKETLQRLMGVHNILFGMSVTGDAVVPMAQVLMTLSGVIGEMAGELQETDAPADEAQNDMNMEELPE